MPSMQEIIGERDDHNKDLESDSPSAEEAETSTDSIACPHIETVSVNSLQCEKGSQSDTVETTATYESFDDEPSIQCNDISTQTDFAPTMSLESFDELNTIRLDCTAKERLTILEQKKNLKKKAIIEGLEIRKRWFQQFQLQAMTHKTLISLKNENETREELEGIHPIRTTVSLPRYYRHSSSQTEISTLLIGLDFEDRLPSEDLYLQIRKLNGHLVTMNDNQFKLKAETNRFRQYCEDLNAGKQITVLGSDLSHELLDEMKLGQLVRSPKTITKGQLQKMITKISNKKMEIFKTNFESFSQFKNEFKADFDYAESIQLPKITAIMSPEAIKKSYENAKLIDTRLKVFLANLNDRLKKSRRNKKAKRNSIKSESSTKVAGSTVGFQSERSSPLQDQQMSLQNSRATMLDDLSTQTDFTPTISRSTFNKYDLIRRNFPDPHSHLSELERLFESNKRNIKTQFDVNQKKSDCQLKDFRKKVLQKKDKIKFESEEFSKFYWLIKGYRDSGFLPNRTEIMTEVRSQLYDSSGGLILVIFLVIAKK